MSGVKKVIISSILLKRDLKLTKLIRQLNDHLRDECAKYNFKYLSNDNVVNIHLWTDGIHLTDAGTYVFGGNLVNFLNHYVLCNVNVQSNEY